MIQEQDIIKAIDTLGLAGKDVCIHASIRAFQTNIDGGMEMIIGAFLSKGCTIMAPTFTYQYEARPAQPYMPERNGAGDYTYFLSREYEDTADVFSVNSKAISVEEMGVFSKQVLDDNSSYRGNHALNSFTAIGPHAKSLTEDQSAKDVYAPFRQLVENNGFILLMGTTLSSATIIHYAEQLAGRTLFIRWAYDKNKQLIPLFTGGCSDGFGKFESILKNVEMETVVGKSVWHCYNARDMVELCAAAIRQNPQITHCNNSHCERCNDAILGGPLLNV